MNKVEWTDPATGKSYYYNWGGFGEHGTNSIVEGLIERLSKGESTERKEYHKMFNNTKIKVIIGGKAYYPVDCTMKAGYRENLRFDITVEKDPSYMIEDYGPKIKDVIFNPPATIVFWTDKTKTVVKAQNDESFDPEKGLVMAYFKKMHGNTGHYFETIKKWTKYFKPNVQSEMITEIVDFKELPTSTELESKKPEEGWVVFYLKKNREADEGYTRYPTVYRHKSSAVRQAKKLVTAEKWFVDRYNPNDWADV